MDESAPELAVAAKQARVRLRAYVRARLRLATAALLWESLWPALWPATLIAGTFAALAAFDVLPLLPSWLHGIVLLGFALALVGALIKAGSNIVRPDRRAAERRLERETGLVHRPLAAIEDQPAEKNLSPAQSELWRAHRQRMSAALNRLKVGLPHAGLARRDPYGIRVILALALIVAIADARDDVWHRLERAVTPHFPTLTALPPSLDVWVVPPEYTGLPTVVLAKSAGGAATVPEEKIPTMNVPAGSTLFAQVRGVRSAPKLRLGNTASAFAPLSNDSFQTSAVLRSPLRAVIEEGSSTLGAWLLAVVPDEPPTIALKERPTQTERGALHLSYHVTDDYGVVSAKGVITRATPGEQPGEAGGGTSPPGTERIEIPLPLPSGPVKDANSTSYHDLTAHPWAGTQVTMTLEATDGAGQTGTSEPVGFILPERQFRNPVARAIIAERKKLTLDPDAHHAVASGLVAIAQQPQQYNNDIVVFMALNSAIDRLMLDDTPSAIASVQSLLWDTALRLEDQGASLAQRDLRQIEKELRDALARGADGDEIKRLMNKLQQAMDRYLEALQQGAEPNEPQSPEGAQNQSAQSYRPEDLRNMLDQARQLAETGDRQAAQQLLSKLDSILENLRTPRQGQSQAQSQARSAMQGLQNLINRQRQLLDRTFHNAQQGAPSGETPEQAPGQGKPSQGKPGQGKPGQGPGQRQGEAQGKGQGKAQSDADAAEQEKLRNELGDTMLKLGDMFGKIPGPLGRAERAMRDSTDALKSGKPEEAVNPQAKALDELQQGMESIRQEMAKRGQQEGAPGEQPGPQQGGQGKDPLGRPLPERGGEGADTSTVRIPEQMELRRAREILDELRKRAGEPDRPAVDHDYIERLLPRF